MMYLRTIPFLRPCAFRLFPFGMKRLGKLMEIYSSSASENGVYSELNKIAANEFGWSGLGMPRV